MPNPSSRIFEFQRAATGYIATIASADIVRVAHATLDATLKRVYDGLLVSSSSLINEVGQIPDYLLQELKELASNGILLGVINDAPSIGKLLAGFSFVFPLTDPERLDAVQIARGIEKYLDDQGYHIEKIAAAVRLHGASNEITEILGQLWTAPSVFVTDFLTEDLLKATQQQGIACFPVVSGESSLLTGPSAVHEIVNTLVLARRINVRETASVIRSGEILEELNRIAVQAKSNLEQAREQITVRYPHLSEGIFDHRSGAVVFEPYEWSHVSDTLNESERRVLGYFNEKLVSYWQPGRPCYRRLLYTPTKVLLRGEQYYVHMKNISPVDRIGEMITELRKIQELSTHFNGLLNAADTTPISGRWKLCLAFLDQLRNIGLQFFSFAHAAGVMLDKARGNTAINGAWTERLQTLINSTYEGENSQLHGFVGYTVRAYYYWLLARPEQAASAYARVLEHAGFVISAFEKVRSVLEGWLGQDGLNSEQLRVDRLVRRWREADHPGENLLIAHVALRDTADDDSISAVGIGWGGIELPLVFRYLAKLEQIKAANAGSLRTYVANWSHYGDERATTSWVAFPRHPDPLEFSSSTCVLFDDNVLTGQTLERIRDEMLLRGASQVRLYVTRFSGERRLAHMKMESHGVIEPRFLLSHVKGYLGETPFARSWSTKKGEYRNLLGVFSLARRRILECIHNNSTVEAWDREGF